MIQNVNTIALATAALSVVGPEKAMEIGRLYRLIDEAMHTGFALGQMASEATLDAAYDNGYVDGVRDARARPDKADQTVADIIADAAQDALNGEVDA